MTFDPVEPGSAGRRVYGEYVVLLEPFSLVWGGMCAQVVHDYVQSLAQRVQGSYVL